MSAFNLGHSNKPVIAVEGIYDKYAIDLFTDLSRTFFILPGTSANSIIKNIQFLNAFNHDYVALWDNDEEGSKQFEKAKKLFGEIESRKFDTLPSHKNHSSRRMEEMFASTDIQLLKEKLGLDEEISYERLITNLYFDRSESRVRLTSLVSDSTKENFRVLKSIIDKRYKAGLEIRKSRE